VKGNEKQTELFATYNKLHLRWPIPRDMTESLNFVVKFKFQFKASHWSTLRSSGQVFSLGYISRTSKF